MTPIQANHSMFHHHIAGLKTSCLLLLMALVVLGCSPSETGSDEIIAYDDIISYRIDPRKKQIRFYSVDDTGLRFENHGTLASWLRTKQDKDLVFATNGGMYREDLSPQGLYIEDGITKAPVDTLVEGYGNFYLQPNGIFYLTASGAGSVVRTRDYTPSSEVQYATQSGPMLVIDGDLHPAFNEDSPNLHIRNGVGVLPNGDLLFAMSKKEVNFFHLAKFFQDNDCQNALYLDGFVSRLYLPHENWVQKDGRFGVIIAEIK